MNLPIITILIITFRRPKEIRRTIDALLRHIVYPRDRLRWLIADDSSGGTYLEDLQNEPRYATLNLQCSLTPKNSGWGTNANMAMNYVTRHIPESELVFFIEDDYQLMRKLDLRAGAALMMVKPEIGMLRYRGSAGTRMIFHLMEADISAYIPDYMDAEHMVTGKLQYMLIDGHSPDTFVYSNGPHLKRLTFHEFYGQYPEGLKLGATEERYCYMVKDAMPKKDAPCIAQLPEWVLNHFTHIGTSYQFSEMDKGITL